MSDCCQSYAWMFDEKQARKDAAGYRRNGLDHESARIVDLLSSNLEGSTVLEVGGGIGAIQLELLKAGAERTTSVELSSEYERVAAELLDEVELRERAGRRVGDFVAIAEEIPAADSVVLNKVVCCYPDMPALIGRACERAGSRLAITMPRDRLLFRAVMRVANLYFRLRRSSFRAFVHSRRALEEVTASHGFALTAEDRGRIWDVLLFERTAPEASS